MRDVNSSDIPWNEVRSKRYEASVDPYNYLHKTIFLSNNYALYFRIGHMNKSSLFYDLMYDGSRIDSGKVCTMPPRIQLPEADIQDPPKTSGGSTNVESDSVWDRTKKSFIF